MPYQYIDNQGTFSLENAENISYLYFPIASNYFIRITRSNENEIEVLLR